MFLHLVEDLIKEINKEDFSEPTACPWYKKGFCRIDGSPCPYSKETYKLCPKLEFAEKHPEQVFPKIEE
jgi:hypothetical protein